MEIINHFNKKIKTNNHLHKTKIKIFKISKLTYKNKRTVKFKPIKNNLRQNKNKYKIKRPNNFNK
jgi:hypothetical protein